MGLKIPKKKEKTLIQKVLDNSETVFSFINREVGLAVLFKMPAQKELQHLYNLCDWGIVKDTEVEDHLWENYVLEYVIAQETPERLDGARASLANGIMKLSIMNNTKDITVLSRISEMQTTYADLIRSYIVSSGNNKTMEDISKMSAYDLLNELIVALAVNKKTVKDLVDKLDEANPNTTGKTQDKIVEQTEQTVADLLKNSAQQPGQNNSAGGPIKTFQPANNAKQARNMAEYENVFKTLDYISATKMPQQVVSERFNITGETSDGASLIDGKIIDDSKPPEPNAKKRVRAKRVIGS